MMSQTRQGYSCRQLVFCIFVSIQSLSIAKSHQQTPPSLSRWVTWWGATPYDDKKSALQPRINAQELITLLDRVVMANTQRLTHSNINPKTLAKVSDHDFVYAARKVLPPSSTVYFWGDLHGDIATLILTLKRLAQQGIINDQLALNNRQIYFIFGGDYVDRGKYGSEVVYVLSHLKIINPDNVFLIRGNHEDIHINSSGSGDFISELRTKFPRKGDFPQLRHAVQKFYTSLPAVLFIGVPGPDNLTTNYLQFCHGCVELGHNPQELIESSSDNEIIGQINRLPLYQKFEQLQKTQPESPQALYMLFEKPKKQFEQQLLKDFMYLEDAAPQNCGYMWSDVTVGGVHHREARYSYCNPGRGLMFGKRLLEDVCARSGWYDPAHRLIAILRAHQHNHSMPKLLCREKHCGGGSTNNNNSLYMIAREDTDTERTIPVFTTVATYHFTPSPSFLQLELGNNPANWNLINHYIDNFYSRFTSTISQERMPFLKAIQEGSDAVWKTKIGRLLSWTNEEN